MGCILTTPQKFLGFRELKTIFNSKHLFVGFVPKEIVFRDCVNYCDLCKE